MGSIRFFFGMCVLFLVATWQSCSELRLSVSGRRAEGTIQQVLVEVKQGTREETGRYLLKFSFRPEAEGARPVQSDVVVDRAEAEAAEPGAKLGVLYLPSNPDLHRVEGHRKTGWVAIFFIFLAILVGWGVWIWRQAMRDLARARR